MVSEDSDELVSGLATVHRLSDAGDLDQTLAGEMSTFRHHANAACELLEVVPLGRSQGMLLKERDHDVLQFVTSTHDVPIQVFTMLSHRLFAMSCPTPKKVSRRSSEERLRSPCVTANSCDT